MFRRARRSKRIWGATAMGAAAAHAGVGECAWRFSGGVRTVRNFLAGCGVDRFHSEREPDRGTSAKDLRPRASVDSGVGRPAFGGGEPGQSLRMGAAPARLLLSLEPLSHRPH